VRAFEEAMRFDRNQLIMADYIPFVYSRRDWTVARSLYPDSAVYRIALHSIPSNLPPDSKLWVDAGADALDKWPFANSNDFASYFLQIPEAAQLADPSFQTRPDKQVTMRFVNGLLDRAHEHVPRMDWLSIPQLPYVDGNERNKVNRSLADATFEWRAQRKFKGKLILPVIFTNQRQLNNKTERNGKVALAVSCLAASGGDGVWVVDSSLNDQAGTGNSEKRFQGIIRLHEEVNAKLRPQTVSVAGPYWALNLILWARGLVHFAAIGVGKGFRYYIPGDRLQEGNPRIALSPLRRQRTWSGALRDWIENALLKIPKGTTAHTEFSSILRNFQILNDREQARMQVARFYGDWFKKIEETSPESRALALYQDFSSAYVLGKSLKDLPPPETPRNASRIAKQFMVSCL
jgi:hypothetical protein